MAHIRHYILGYRKHGDNKQNTYFETHFGLQNLLLHSWKLAFTPSYSTDPIQLVCPPPTHFLKTANLLGWNLNELR